jgi:hypothetical protein
MALSAEAANKAERTGRRGDYWARSWTRTTGTRVYDEATLVVQLRAGDDESSKLLASTANGKGYNASKHALITTTGTDFDGDPIVFAWQCANSERVPAGDQQVLAAQCEIDGKLEEFLHRRWTTLPQVAVEAPE